MKLISCTHAAYNRNIPFPGKFRKDNFRTDRIDRIYYIMNSSDLFQKFFCIVRQNKSLVCFHFDIRIDVFDSLSHHIRFHSSDRTMISNRLPVNICKRYIVIVDQYQSPDTAPCQCFDTVRSDASYTKHGNRCFF